MQHPLQITFRNMVPSEALRAEIEERIQKLDLFYQRITSCHVVVEAPHRSHQQGKIFHVTIHMAVPGAELVVNRNPSKKKSHENPYVAVHDAFDAIWRQLEDYTRRHQEAS